jgi:hypothetical protein
VIIVYPDKSRKTVSYPKYLVECELGRYLEDDETVDHIDGDFTNNDFANLQVLSRKEHVSLDVKRLKTQRFECPLCSDSFELKGSKLYNAAGNRKQGKAGPFCSRTCAGKYGAEVQNERMKRLSVSKIKKSYMTIKDEPYKGNPISGRSQVGETLTRNGDGNPELADNE